MKFLTEGHQHYSILFIVNGNKMFPSSGKLKKMSTEEIPFIMVNSLGLIVYVNKKFMTSFGWKEDNVIGQTLDLVLPESFRMSHHLAFSNFSSSAPSEVIGHPLILKTRCADGSEIDSEHYIIAEQESTRWFFGAQLKPL